MQVINASELFNNMGNFDSTEFESANGIDIDFTDICSIDLNKINILLNIKKVAVLNNKKLYVSNVNPQVRQILDVTGLDNIIKNTTNPIRQK